MEEARGGAVFPGNVCTSAQDWGKCSHFGAFTKSLKDSLEGELRNGFHIDVDKEDDDDEDDDCRKLVRIPHLFIPANGKLRATVIISPPPKAKLGSKYQFTIMQNLGATVIGGSTYEVRIPPAEEGIHECSAS